MTRTEPRDPQAGGEGFDQGFAGHRSRQARAGLLLTPAERLQWLERTMEEMRRLLGRAKQGRKIGSDPR
jgi:hypothetical protein